MALYGNVEVPGRPDAENVRQLDLLPLPAIRRMGRLGFAIDAPYFHDLSSDFAAQLIDKRKAIASYIPPDKLEAFVELSGGYDDDVDESALDVEVNPDSGKQLSTLLFDVLGIGKGKKLKTTKGGDRLATDKKQLEMLKRDNPIIAEILEYRQIAKLKGTYTDKLPRIARLHKRGADCGICGLAHDADTLRVHTQILGTRTATGRYASKNPNLQNIPAKTESGRLVRAGFIASPGTVLVQRDFSQIEVRMLAHISADDNLIRIFLDDIDMHIDTACRAFGLKPEEVDKHLHRAPAKTTTFLVVYGGTEIGLLEQLTLLFASAGVQMPVYINEAWCKSFIRTWFDCYPGVSRFMEHEQHCVMRYGITWTICGRVRRIPEVRSVHNRIQQVGLRAAGNMKDQGSSADLMKLALAATDERAGYLRDCDMWAWPLLTIHDELIYETAEGEAADAMEVVLQEEMDNVMVDRQTGRNVCRVPIKSDGGQMLRWQK